MDKKGGFDTLISSPALLLFFVVIFLFAFIYFFIFGGSEPINIIVPSENLPESDKLITLLKTPTEEGNLADTYVFLYENKLIPKEEMKTAEILSKLPTSPGCSWDLNVLKEPEASIIPELSIPSKLLVPPSINCIFSEDILVPLKNAKGNLRFLLTYQCISCNKGEHYNIL